MSDHSIQPAADHSTNIVVQAAIDDHAARDAEFGTLQASILARLKPILFNALKTVGIVCVTVNFDGCGDSGQIESVEARDSDNNPVELPAETITYPVAYMEKRYEPRPDSPGGKLFTGYDHRETEQTTPIQEVIENIFWGFIGAKHGGWENNDGGFGECVFEVGSQTIRLEMNERYTETNYYEYEV